MIFVLCYNYVIILRSSVVGFLGSTINILPRVMLIIFLYWHLGIWVLENSNFMCDIWSCLCCVGILFLGSIAHSGF